MSEEVKEEVKVEKEVKARPKHSLLTNPRSKYFNSKIAKRRAKERARRKANRINRHK